ncbi:MAG TPA: hypothetical protein VNL12_02985 [Iamia sp.]|nr:hypothetical protein [Iamia sp.]HXH56245.1 hypothetical protein [Iamia sp.]
MALVYFDSSLDTSDLVVAVWDRRLHAGATAEHLAVAPATLGP